MSVLIKGMEMPLRCFECPCCHTIGYFECVLMHKDLRREHGINISRPDWCPLIDIPTPHGRLIDADKLNTYDLSPVNGFCVIGVTEEDIGLAETILEAEGSEE